MSAQEKSSVICWDLDETLGEFRRIAYQMQGKQAPDWMNPISTRYGIRKTLRDLRKKGYVHVLTTSGITRYADTVLQVARLRREFSEVFGREHVSKLHWGKEYSCVANKIGYSLEDMRGKSVVVGDAPGDQPMDIVGLLFINLGSHYDARVIQPVLNRLYQAGHGHFLKGYESLYETTPDVDERGYQNKVADFGDGITALLEYRTNSGSLGVGEKVVPTICDFRAPGFRRKPIRVRGIIA